MLLQKRKKLRTRRKGVSNLKGKCIFDWIVIWRRNRRIRSKEKSRKVVGLPPRKNTTEDKPSSQDYITLAWIESVIGVSIVLLKR